MQKAVELLEKELGVQLTEAVPGAANNVPRAATSTAHDSGEGSNNNRAFKQRLLQMLEEMRTQFTQEDLKNPTIKRLYQFTEDYARFIVDGYRTDSESDRLSREIDWMRSSGKVSLPAEVCDRMKHILRVEAPRSKARIASLMQAHYAFMMSGKGNRMFLEREIATLRPTAC